jgi:4-amino-4-deoxy-L-arabinose transferase-like glycosyltransferase
MLRRRLPFLAIFIIAAALRLIALDTTPPGLQHDEVFHGHDAVTVLLGNRPLYFTSNAGNEPLFIYLMSITIGLFGHNEWGIRLAAVICGLLTLVFTYLWIRRAFNQRTALVASALLAVNFWPLFLSRAGLRAASVPMLAALTAFLIADFRFWISDKTACPPHYTLRSALLAGIALGLSLYTYPAARTLPVIVVTFCLVYSLIARRLNKALLLVLIVAAIVFSPLGYTLATLPEADTRLQQLGGPVQAALGGNFEPVLRYTRATLGLFTFGGDPIARYNLPGRPVFDPITGLLFYLGLVLAIRQWREPRYLFALIWLPIGLLPSMLSDSAPSFLRASASLPVTFLFPALAVDWLIANRQDAKTRRVIGGVAAIGLLVTAALTMRDYFVEWPNRADVREVYRADLALAAKWIEQQPADQPIVVAGTNPRDLDPFLFDFQLSAKRDVKWVDRAFGLVLPASPGKVISPVFSPLDPALRRLIADTFVRAGLASGPQTIFFADGSPAFEVFEVRPYPVSPSGPRFAAVGAQGTGPTIELAAYELAGSARAGESLFFTLAWRVVTDTAGAQLPVSIFAHLLDVRGEFAAGRDLLAFPSAGWRAGDWWYQRHDLPIPADLQPGQYQIEIGVYSQADGSRWRALDAAGNDIGDRWAPGTIQVIK